MPPQPVSRANPAKVLDPKEPKWLAVYTRYKREKMVVKRLLAKGVEAWVPVQKLTRRYTRKVRKVELPLISCYVFVRIIKPQYVPVLEDPDVVNFIQFKGELVPVPQKEIDLLRRIVGEGVEAEATPLSLEPGDEVEVIAGQLTGLRGKLVEMKNEKNLLIELDHIGYALRIYVAPESLVQVRQN